MKKLLLSAMFVCIAYFANAQIVETTTGWSDDFGPSNPLTGAVGFYNIANGVYSVTQPGDGYLHVACTNADVNYATFGLYGIHAVNIGSNRIATITATNSSSTQAADIKFWLKDQDGRDSVSINSSDNSGTAYTISLAAGQTQTVTFTFGTTVYAQRYTSEDKYYPAHGPCVNEPCYIPVTALDSIVGFGMMINPGGTPNAFNGTILIDQVKIGTATGGTLTSGTTGIFSPSVSNSKMIMTPNPASSTVKISYTATTSNVIFNITDITGKTVKSVNGADSIAEFNVADLTKGMYFVTAISDNLPVSVSKLIVE